MGRRGDRSIAALLLTQRIEPAAAEPLKASEFWPLVDRLPELEVLLDRDVEGIVEASGVDRAMAERLRALLDAATAFAFRLDQAEQAGLRIVSAVDGEYPAALLGLGHGAPPVLYAYGDVGLLAQPATAVVAVDAGVDDATLDGGAPAVGVLAGALQRAVREADHRKRISQGRLCLLSPFPPDAHPTAAAVAARDRLVQVLTSAGTRGAAGAPRTG